VVQLEPGFGVVGGVTQKQGDQSMRVTFGMFTTGTTQRGITPEVTASKDGRNVEVRFFDAQGRETSSVHFKSGRQMQADNPGERLPTTDVFVYDASGEQQLRKSLPDFSSPGFRSNVKNPYLRGAIEIALDEYRTAAKNHIATFA
jgi:hypothetical protein